jgi:hypothetical protein
MSRYPQSLGHLEQLWRGRFALQPQCKITPRAEWGCSMGDGELDTIFVRFGEVFGADAALDMLDMLRPGRERDNNIARSGGGGEPQCGRLEPGVRQGISIRFLAGTSCFAPYSCWSGTSTFPPCLSPFLWPCLCAAPLLLAGSRLQLRYCSTTAPLLLRG